MNPLKRLFSYTFRFKFSFILSIFGFILFASADIAAVEWIRRLLNISILIKMISAYILS
jgi:hypothetical protein